MGQGLGELRALLLAVGVLADESVSALGGGPRRVELPTLSLATRNLSRQFQSALGTLRETLGGEQDAEFDRFSEDMSRLVNLGRSAHLLQLRRLGEWALSKEG
jgi:hypothetical protein